MCTEENYCLEKEDLVEELNLMISYLEQEASNATIFVKKNKDELVKVSKDTQIPRKEQS